MCCYRYYTIGTAQKDWYLPAVGELVYIIPRNKEIIDGLVLCGISTSNTSGLSYLLGGRMAVGTSTEIAPLDATVTNEIEIINTGGGNVTSSTKTNSINSMYYVAFIKI